MFKHSLAACEAAAFALCASLSHAADNNSNKTVTWIVPFPAGGSTDIFAPVLSAPLQKSLVRPMLIDNRGGAGGAIGVSLASKARPDGYTITSAAISTHAINASLYPDLQYDPVKNFEPVI